MNGALAAIRTRLSGDAHLSGLFMAEYGLPLKHLIGFKKALKADDYPILSYVCTKAIYPVSRKPKNTEFAISLVLGINDSVVVNEQGVTINDAEVGNAPFLSFAGSINSSVAVELILDSLRTNPVLGDYFMDSDFVVFPELPPSTPFFNTEISFILKKGAR